MIWKQIYRGFAVLLVLTACSYDSGTLYAPQFSEKNFHNVTPGMGSNAVVQLLGMPLSVVEQRFGERWIYGESRKPNFSTLWNSSESVAAPRFVVFFAESGIAVDQLGGGQSVLGQRRSSINATFGPPDRAETNAAVTIFKYTEAKRSGSHHVRAILFDRDTQVVVGKKSFYYTD